MRIAAAMLRQQRENACSVAYSVGFNSEAAFNRAFKRAYGTPPAAWRRGIAQMEKGRGPLTNRDPSSSPLS